MFKLKIFFFCSLIVYCSGDDSVPCGDSLECIETKLKTYVDKLETKSDTNSLISFEKVTNVTEGGNTNEDLFDRCVRFLRENEIRVRIPQEYEQRSLETESRSKKLRRLILPLILLLKLKAAIVIPAVLTMISFLSFTGFKSGLAALAISTAVALKSFLEHQGQSKISYEILPSITSGWNRNSIDANVATVPVAGYETIVQ